MQAKMVVSAISLFVAGLWGVIFIVVGGLFGFMVATGGLYGNGSLSDATIAEIAIGLDLLALSCLPLALVSSFAIFWWRGLRLPEWSTQIGWISAVCILAGVCLELLSVSFQRGGFRYESLSMLTLPVLPFALGLLGFLAFSTSSKGQ